MHFKTLTYTFFYRIQTYFHLKNVQRYCHTQILEQKYDTGNMSAWQITTYGGENNLQFTTNFELPIIDDPNSCLIKVSAASVNPLDIEMMRGFGSVLLKNMRQIESLCQNNSSELPLILGRDFAGIVVAKGNSVVDFQIGDEVYGVVKPQHQGCHAEYTVTSDKLLIKKPKFISMEKASAILYTSLTAWCALKISGSLIISPPKNKRVLILGASGGVGQSAIQLLHAWGSQVIAICRTDAISYVEKLSPESIIDYTSPDYLSEIRSKGMYDIILDAAGLSENELGKYVDFVNPYGSIITLRSPLLANIDNYGLLYGSVKSAVDLILPNLTSGIFKKGSLIKWAFFMPCQTAVKEISELVEHQQLLPIIEKIYSFSDTPEAYERIKAAHLRGKIVISMNEKNEKNSKIEE